ncbi:hypothetical protein [Agrobacterium salinitolerans]|uniref:hypothetical protein n=1 Tax=Agrobacterium salinitolerans TaxID=1183413 RepID=UPI0022B84AA7|nr:hypothetical protein [Agrobacterium salinitolerans]MCZ7857080.1 hypothetical protein [Agrobacterium salinitolerans]MCZ7885839.1 hypothetical protein [Agrobacterium salinitolerans]
MIIVLPALIGALVGAGITLIFNLWKFHRDERAARCDELCKSVQEAAIVALDYWVKDYKKNNEQVIAETKLQAAQNLLELLYEDFSTYLSESNANEIEAVLSQFTRTITGGQYTELGRKADIERAKLTGPQANRLSVSIRRANRETLPFHNLVLAFHLNKRRKLDMPVHRCGSY